MSLEPTEPHLPTSRPGWQERLRALALDVTPLRVSRDFRLLWSGHAVSNIGSHLTFVAVPFQVFQLTDSTLAVGLLGLCELFPILFLSLLGGSLADALDRRKLLLVTESLWAFASAGLAFNASLDEPRVWPLFVLFTVMSSLYALSSPAFRSATPLLLPKQQLPAAAALDGVSGNFSALAGPAVAGILIGAVGLTATYALDVLSFGASIVGFALVRPLPPDPGAERPGRRSMLEGVRFLKGRSVLQGSFIVDLIAMVFGMPKALFPAIARSFGGPAVFGLLHSATAAGALLASLSSGWVGAVRRQGVVVYASVIAWGAAVIVFGAATALWMALLGLFIAGAADAISAIFRHAILQAETPPAMIGRLSGLELTVVATGPAMGDIEAGVLAALTSVRFSVIAGGVACIAGVGLMALLMPAFAAYEAPARMPDAEGAPEGAP